MQEIRNKKGDLLLCISGPLGSFHYSDRKLDDAVVQGLDLEGALLDGSSMRGAIFAQCVLYWACFICANLSNAQFIDCDMRGVGLQDANCKDTLFQRCNLGLDNLGQRGALLMATNLTGARFENCVLHGAVYNDQTIFPMGFQIKDSGMIREK